MGSESPGAITLASPQPRPQILAVPSPTISRFLLLVAALLSSGLFVGTWIHNQSAVGDDWLERLRECESRRPPLAADAGTAELLRAEEWFLRCAQPAQETLAWYALFGVGLTIVAGVAILAVVPVVIRRRRELRPLGPRLESASSGLAAIARDTGLRRSPRAMIGSSKLRDAFSYGFPGHYAIALPPALVVRSTGPAFDPIVRHEVAHIARHDVLIAWSARAFWIAVAVLLAAPVLVAIVQGDVSLLPSYLWRAALLVGVTLVASAGILRAREYDADVSSATTEHRRAALRALLGTSARAAPRVWGRALARHPSAADRSAVLENPALLARPSWVDAALAAFLASVVMPLLVSVFATVPSITAWAYSVPAILVGPLMGATVGLSLWRVAIVDRVITESSSIAPAARRLFAGVFVGYLLGGFASLAEVGSVITITTRIPIVLLDAVLVAGATFLAAGVAVLAGSRAAHFSARTYTAGAIALSGIVFAFVLWASTTVTRSWDLAGWSLARRVILDVLTQAPAASVVLVLGAAVLALLALRSSPSPPAWAVDERTPALPERAAAAPAPPAPPALRTVLLLGMATGAAAALVILVFRAAVGPAEGFDEQVQRYEAYTWVFAGAGAATAVSLLLFHGITGAGAGLLAAPVASVTSALGFIAMNTFYGGAVSLGFIEGVVRPGVVLGALLLVLVSVIAVLPLPRASHARPVLVILVAAVVGALVAGGTLALRDAVSPLPAVDTDAMAVEEYVTGYAPLVDLRLSELDQTVASISADTTSTSVETAGRIRAEIVSPLAELEAGAADVGVDDESLETSHRVLLAGLETLARAYEMYAVGYETGDGELLLDAGAAQRLGVQEIQAWRTSVAARLAGG